MIVLSGFDPILDRCSLWNWKVKCSILTAHTAVLSCAGPLLKLEIQVVCISWAHRECTSLANACVRVNTSHVHMFIYVYVTQCVCTGRKSTCAQLCLRVLSQHV